MAPTPPSSPQDFDPALDGPLEGLRALVLGATGMIGAHTVRALLARRVVVRALVRPGSRAVNLAGLDVERRSGDLRDPESLLAAAQGCDLLVHAAAPYPRSHFRAAEQTAAAVESMRGVLRCAREHLAPRLARAHSSPSGAAGSGSQPSVAELRGTPGIKRVVYVSSLTTIGPAPPGAGASDRNGPGRGRPASAEESASSRQALASDARNLGRPRARETDFFPADRERSPYFRMKTAMEQVALAAAGDGLPIVVVNPSLCIDAFDVTPTTGQLLLGVERGLFRVGLPGVVDAVATRDVGVGIARALAVGRVGERYILGGESLPLRELLARIARVAGVPEPRGTLPLELLEAVAWLSEVWNRIVPRPWPAVPLSSVRMLRHAQPLDTTKARTELGLPHTPLEVAIRDALDFLHAAR